MCHMNRCELSWYVREENTALLALVINHPMFEQYKFTNSFNKTKEKEDLIYCSYDAYATMVFNFLATMYDHARKENILYDDIVEFFHSMLYFEEYVFMHRKWWEICNYAYDPDFVDFINRTLKQDIKFYWME